MNYEVSKHYWKTLMVTRDLTPKVVKNESEKQKLKHN